MWRVFWEYCWVENSWAGTLALLILVNSSTSLSSLYGNTSTSVRCYLWGCISVYVCVCVCVRGVIRTVKSSHLIAAILLIASPQLLFTCNLTCQDVATSTTMNKWLSFFFSFFLAHSTLHTAPHRNDCICVQWSTVKATHSAQWKSTHISICLLFVFIPPFPFSLSSFLASILSILDQTNESCRHRVIGQSVCRCMSVWGRVWMGFYCCSEGASVLARYMGKCQSCI